MNSCSTCDHPKAALQCGLCATSLCKSCARFLDDEEVSFFGPMPADLSHECYCDSCYQSRVSPHLDECRDTLERAKNVNVFFKTQGKETRFIRRSEKRIQVSDCADRDEAVLRLAYLAARNGFNALIDVDLSSAKIRNGGWQTSTWSGTAIPARVDEADLARKFISSPN